MNNYGIKGGVLFASDNSQVYIYDTHIEGNYALDSAVFRVQAGSKLNMRVATVIYNVAVYKYSIGYFMEGDFSLI